MVQYTKNDAFIYMSSELEVEKKMRTNWVRLLGDWMRRHWMTLQESWQKR